MNDILTSTRGQEQSMRQIMITNMGYLMISLLKKIKALDFVMFHDNDLNTYSGMILEMVYECEVHN